MAENSSVFNAVILQNAFREATFIPSPAGFDREET